MLIFAKVFGSENKRISVELAPSNTVGEFKQYVLTRLPGSSIARVLFRGRLLSDDSQPLEKCDVYKECTIQVMVRHANQRRRRDTLPTDVPAIGRQATMTHLQFGDVVLINLIAARDLSDPESDDLNPYVVFSHSDQVQKSTVAQGSQDPDWHETFGFHLAILGGVIEDEYITLNLYNRNLKQSAQDNHLGTVQFTLSDIVRSESIERVENLDNGGRIIVTFYRASIVDEMMVDGLRELIKKETNWTEKDLRNVRLTLRALVGEEPFSLSGDANSPKAVLHLQDTLRNGLELDNVHNAAKARRILSSQMTVLTKDEISRHLWFSNLDIDEQTLIQSFADQDFKNFTYFKVKNYSGAFAFVTFISKEAALTNLLRMKLVSAKDVCVGFGKPRQFLNPVGEVEALEGIEGMLQISNQAFRDLQAEQSKSKRNGELWLQQKPRTEGFIGWAVLTSERLVFYKRLQNDETPDMELVFSVKNAQVVKRNKMMIHLKIGEGENEEMIYISSPIKNQALLGWGEALEAILQKKDVLSLPGDYELNGKSLGCYMRLENDSTLRLIQEIVDDFSALYNESKFPEIAEKFTSLDLGDLLSPEVYQQLLDDSLDAVVQGEDSYVRCPKCSTVIETSPGPSRSYKEQDVMLDMIETVDGSPWTEKGKKHFSTHRINCRNCFTDFCSKCLQTPYHMGCDCKTYEDLQNAPRCRFCKCVIPNYQNKQLDGSNMICDQEECQEYNKIASHEILPCGHLSPGLKGSRVPCLEANCPARPQEINATLDDTCTICKSEMHSQPLVVLNCSHVFHYNCLIRNIKAQWPKEYITFEFLACPLCKKQIWHSSFMEELRDPKKLQAQVIRDGLKKMKQEGLDNHPKVKSPDGAYYKDPIAFSQHHYAFYQCFQCKLPYFGGARACGDDSNDEILREDLICSNCQNVDSVEECPKHGRQYIAFKCKYCCKLSVFHCWGKVHFCVNCHKSDVWDKLTTYATGVNKKNYEDYEQCAEIRKQMDEYLKDPKWRNPANREELDNIFREFHSNPSTCPLNIRHRTNGEEFGLGCTMCADEKTEEDNRRAKEKAENEAKARMRSLMKFMDDIPNPSTYQLAEPMDTNGIMYFFGTSGNTQPWRNPAEAGMVIVSGSQLMKDSAPITSMVGRDLVRCVTIQDQSNPWFSIDFVDKYVNPSAYMLRHYASWDTECLRNWVFEGSMDGERWVRLKHHDNDTTLSKKGQAATWSIQQNNPCYFRKFRVKQTGPNSNLHNYLANSGFELYGTLNKQYSQYFETAFEDALKAQEKKEKKDREKFWQKLSLGNTASFTFLFENHFDENGIIYFLGTKGGTQDFVNPVDQNLVAVTSIGTTKDSTAASAICGRDLVRCVTQPVENAWFCIDFMDKWIQPTLYTLRHYSSWDTECLRNWVLEGSNDGRRWEVVMRHINDTSLNEKGACHTWPIPTQARFSKWRIRQTGLNSNKHKYLACSGVEFYGKIYTATRESTSQSGPSQSNLEFLSDVNYDGNDFGQAGLFYYLGTNFKREKWKNPDTRGLVKVEASSLCPDSDKANAIVGRSVVRCVTKPHENSWFCVDLKDFRLYVTAYTLRHYSSWDVEALRNWVFEGSQDNQRWSIIGTYLNDQSLNARGAARTWLVKNPNVPFRYFRVRQIGPNSNKHLYLACSGMELYGRLMRVKGGSDRSAKRQEKASSSSGKKKAGRMLPQSEKENLRKHLEAGKGLAFRYHADMDENGIVYFLGTNWKTDEWKNPALERGVISVSSSRLAKDSAPAWSVVGRKVVRCVCFPERQNWFLIDFKDKYIRPSRYTLRHYSSWETEALRNWVLEGSVDLQKYQILREHRNDTKLYGIGATATWKLEVKGRYRAFRIRQFGLNSNNHLYLSLSGFEIYGEMYFHPK